MAKKKDALDITYAGVDTHKDTHALCILDSLGTIVFEGEFKVNTQGYKALGQTLLKTGNCECIAIEGTATYGKGLAEYLLSLGFNVKEALRPGKRIYNPAGKTDAIDAHAAALSALFGDYAGDPKDTSGPAGDLSFLVCARESAIKETTSLINQVQGLLVRAPEQVRHLFCGLSSPNILEKIYTLRNSQKIPSSLLLSLKSLAKRYRVAKEVINELDEAINHILNEHYPHLLGIFGVSTAIASTIVSCVGDNPARFTSEAAFAKTAGVCPIPASSGKTTHYRLNRGGDRRLNKALYQIALVRLGTDPKTQAYKAKKIKEGKSKKDVIRCIKRYIAREIYKCLCEGKKDRIDPCDLRIRRNELGLTLKQVAISLNTSPAKVSKIERNIDRDTSFEKTYWSFLHNYQLTLN